MMHNQRTKLEHGDQLAMTRIHNTPRIHPTFPAQCENTGRGFKQRWKYLYDKFDFLLSFARFKNESGEWTGCGR